MKVFYLFLALVWAIRLFAQPVPIESVRNACGSGYFIDNESHQPAMLVRGFFCGNSYIYTPIAMGDSIKELAYVDHTLFTGTAEDYDTANHVIGRYTFKEGLLQTLEEFHPSGEPLLQLQFENGNQHGVQLSYNRQGKIERMNTYNMGVLHGPFFHAWYGDFDQCLVKGYAVFGEHHYFRGFEPCSD
jgi:hypothetical protein